MRIKLGLRVWILIIALILSVIAIAPSPSAKGVQIINVEDGSFESLNGINKGEIIKSINRINIETLSEYKKVIDEIKIEPVKVKFEFPEGVKEHEVLEDIGIIVDENLTILSSKYPDIKKEDRLLRINDKEITDLEEFTKISDELVPKIKLVIDTNKKQYAYLTTSKPKIIVGEARKSNIEKGLDLQGGTRVILKPMTEEVADEQINDLVSILENRLNVYGLADVKVRGASDLEGNKFVIAELAGVSQEEVRELISKQGKFEAKIENKTVFTGSSGDIAYVCRNDGSCSGIVPPCFEISQSQWACKFEFVIKLSGDAAKKHAEATKNIGLDSSEAGRYLLKNLDMYLDDGLVSSLRIGADLGGREVTDFTISGNGFGASEEAAFESAQKEMNKLQTVLITGSLPFKLEVIKLDSISPVLGKEFIKNSLLVGLFAIICVTLVVYLRYRRWKITFPILITSISEIILTLGIASLIRWNIDVAAIAGIIAAVGTGVDDQIVITDEAINGIKEQINWKQRLKNAFYIILTAYAATTAAMIPLWWAGAGLIRGFAVTTIIGITVGVLITRPAFAAMVEKLVKD